MYQAEEQGWVYVLLNSSMPGLVKVGRTLRPPAERAAELSAVTGVATPFVVAFDQQFADCVAAEQSIHAELERRGLRIAANREFFRGGASEIIRVVLDHVPAGPADPKPCHITTAASLLAAGDRFYYGQGDTLQDTGEALRCYKLAAARGALRAYEQIGRIYLALFAHRPDRVSRRRVLAPLKEGARRGNYYCYPLMAAVFASEGHAANFTKSWALFFSRREQQDVPDLETGTSRFAAAASLYIIQCLQQGQSPAHFGALQEEADGILAALISQLGKARRDTREHDDIAAALRWAYQSLLPGLRPTHITKPRDMARPGRMWLTPANAAPA